MSQFPIQNQPAWVDGRTAESSERTRVFFRSVYAWMFGGLLLTSLASMWVVASPAMQQLVLANRMVFFGLIIAEFGLVLYLNFAINKMSGGAAASAFLIYSLLNGLTLSVIFFVYTQGSIVRAFATAAVTFGAMSIYGMVTKRDLTRFGAFLFMGVIGILITMVINMFIRSTALDMAISLIGVFVFLGLTAYRTQELKAMAQVAGDRSEQMAIIGALGLYLAFINIFLFLLRLFGGRRD
ncbi:MAG: Bax inhibitor-1/YccA family protein [Thermoanaerobaculia bacterium]|nr:Bax inhibitor-1/YccA family protein [Thermoanaerobaculia bacterium]